jgi:hypothetical protein
MLEIFNDIYTKSSVRIFTPPARKRSLKQVSSEAKLSFRATTPKPHETLACIREGRARSEGPLLSWGKFSTKEDPLCAKVGH